MPSLPPHLAVPRSPDQLGGRRTLHAAHCRYLDTNFPKLSWILAMLTLGDSHHRRHQSRKLRMGMKPSYEAFQSGHFPLMDSRGGQLVPGRNDFYYA